MPSTPTSANPEPMAIDGIFITFEGIDGAGKSSHVQSLGQLFTSAGREVLLTREPGGTPLAESLRGLVLHQPMDGLTEALLVFAARRDHLVTAIEPMLRRGGVVLSDRFTDSSFAYQGGGQGLDWAVLEALERWVQGDSGIPNAVARQPDLTLWFDLDPALAAARLANARAPDRFEARGSDYFSRVAHAYRQRARAFPERFCRIDAALPHSAVWETIRAVVLARGWLA